MSPKTAFNTNKQLHNLRSLIAKLKMRTPSENLDDPSDFDSLIDELPIFNDRLATTPETTDAILDEGHDILKELTLLVATGDHLSTLHQTDVQDILKPLIRSEFKPRPRDYIARIVAETLGKYPFIRKGSPEYINQPQYKALDLLRECVRVAPELLKENLLLGKLFVEAGFASDFNAAATAAETIKISMGKIKPEWNAVEYALKEIKMEAKSRSPIANKSSFNEMWILLAAAERAALDQKLQTLVLKAEIEKTLANGPK